MALCLAGCRSAEEKVEYEAKKKALAAELDKKEADAKAKRAAAEASLRAACKDQSVDLPTDEEIVRWCKDEALTKGSDISFPTFVTKKPPVVNGCLIVYLSTLETKGAEKDFRCEYNPKTKRVTVKL